MYKIQYTIADECPICTFHVALEFRRRRFKEQQALLNGFSVIRLYQYDVWKDLNDWETRLSNTITSLRASETPLVKRLE